jgi:hypothetical protein
LGYKNTYNAMNLEKHEIVQQTGFFKDHSYDTDSPLLDLKLSKNISNPTDSEARRLQRKLKKKGWACYGAEKRRGNLYVKYIPSGAI